MADKDNMDNMTMETHEENKRLIQHEIHNEIGHEQVYDDVASWIEEAVVH